MTANNNCLLMDTMPKQDIGTVTIAGLEIIYQDSYGLGVKKDGEFIGSIDEKHFRRAVIREAKDSHASPSINHWMMFGNALWCDKTEEYAYIVGETDDGIPDTCPECGEKLGDRPQENNDD